MAVTEMISVYGDRLDDDRKREELAMIAHDVDRLTALLENVVTLERSDSDMFNFEPEATDVGALCRRVADHALLLVKGQNAVNIAGDASLGRVNADPELLEHILSNVISNAVKYSPEHADIDVHLARNGEMLLIDVTDSGIGIPAKEMAQIGTPFYRASKAAVNMIMRNISHSLKDQGIVVVLVNPGPVDTDMMARARGRMPLRTTTLAVDEMVTVIDNATLNDTATFYNFDGTVLPW